MVLQPVAAEQRHVLALHVVATDHIAASVSVKVLGHQPHRFFLRSGEAVVEPLVAGHVIHVAIPVKVCGGQAVPPAGVEANPVRSVTPWNVPRWFSKKVSGIHAPASTKSGQPSWLKSDHTAADKIPV